MTEHRERAVPGGRATLSPPLRPAMAVPLPPSLARLRPALDLPGKLLVRLRWSEAVSVACKGRTLTRSEYLMLPHSPQGSLGLDPSVYFTVRSKHS